MTMPEGLNRPPDDRIVRLQRPAGNGRDRQPDVAQLVQHLKTMFEALAKGQSTPISRPQLYIVNLRQWSQIERECLYESFFRLMSNSVHR